MRKTPVRTGLTAVALSMALFCAPIAMAATGPAQGNTSGPAAGTNVKPNTAIQKQASNPHTSVAAGAPGTSGERGTESGAKPSTSTTKH